MPAVSAEFYLTEQRVKAELGMRIRWVREALEDNAPGLHTQQAWARWLNIDQGMLSRWETGQFTPPIHILRLITLATGASANFLLSGVIDNAMDPWLAQKMRHLHPEEVRSAAEWQERRQEIAALSQRSPPPDTRPRRRARRERPRK
jgi:DNA-binding transcriptional regulator YiaG